MQQLYQRIMNLNKLYPKWKCIFNKDYVVPAWYILRDILYRFADETDIFKNRKEVKELLKDNKIFLNFRECNENDIVEWWRHIITINYKKKKHIDFFVEYYTMSLRDKIKNILKQLFLFKYDKDINCLYIPLILYPRIIWSIINKEYLYINDYRKEIYFKNHLKF